MCSLFGPQLVTITYVNTNTWQMYRMYTNSIYYCMKLKWNFIIAVKQHCVGIFSEKKTVFNPLNAELNPICYLLALLGAHHFLHVSRIRVKPLNLRLLMSYIYEAPK